MSNINEILLPDVGGEEVEIIEIVVKKGDSINIEDPILTVETEKASMDIPSLYSGMIQEINVKVGDKVSQGSLICSIKDESSSSSNSEDKKSDIKNDEVKVEISKEVSQETNKNEENLSKDNNNSNSSNTLQELFLPDVGGEEVEIIEIVVKKGDSINIEDPILTVETEKASMDIPSLYSGVIDKLNLKVGDKVSQGALICTIKTSTESSSNTSSSSNTKKIESNNNIIKEDIENKTIENNNNHNTTLSNSNNITNINNQVDSSNILNKVVHSSPSVRKLARQFGVDLSKVPTTGRKNRVLEKDIKVYVKNSLAQLNSGNNIQSANSSNNTLGFNLPPLKEIDFTAFGDIEIKPLTRIQKISGPSLHRNAISIPHVTQFDEADISQLEKFRKEQNEVLLKTKESFKISPLIFIIKAVSKALEIHPIFNSSLSSDGSNVILKKYINIGVAVDTPNGLVVPVIKDVNKKGINELALELTQISQKARDGKLKLEDMSGACFTISSLGGIGGVAFTPIINAPEVAILGVSKSQIKPQYDGENFIPRLMLPISLSYDHRVIDGAIGARFCTTLTNMLSDIRLLIL
jgi:pyruvate dehydrogenase E2 component (dihydrolipoamide acetyltransferase)